LWSANLLLLGFPCVALFNVHLTMRPISTKEAKKKYKRRNGVLLLCENLPPLRYFVPQGGMKFFLNHEGTSLADGR